MWRCRHPRPRRLRPAQQAVSLPCPRPSRKAYSSCRCRSSCSLGRMEQSLAELPRACTHKSGDGASGLMSALPPKADIAGRIGMSAKCHKRSFPNRSGREPAIPRAPSGAQANQSISGPGAALRRPLATEQRPFVRERNGHRSFIDRPVGVGEQPMIATPDGRASRRHVAATDLSRASPSGKRSRSAAAPLSQPAPWQGA